jgi:integrase
VILVGEADVRAAAGRVAAVLVEAGRAEGTVRRYQAVMDRLAVFLVERGNASASEQMCLEFIANETGYKLGSLREPGTSRAVQAVRRPVVLMVDVLAGRELDLDRAVVPAKDACPATFRSLRDDYLASCRRRGNAEATVVAKDKAVSRFLAYLDDVGAADLAVLGVGDLSGFFLRQRRLRRKTITSMRSCLADFLDFSAAVGRTPRGLADRLPPQKYVRHESEPHLWTADEIRRTLAGIDRQSATGKRDYAMILATARLGLRISDLRHLELGDLDWRAKRITIVQHKTGRPLNLPLWTTSAGRSSITSEAAVPRRPARRCSSSTATPSTRSGALRRSPPGCRATPPAPVSTSRRARSAGCTPCAARWPWP